MLFIRVLLVLMCVAVLESVFRKLVSLYSTIKMTHVPINIRLQWILVKQAINASTDGFNSFRMKCSGRKLWKFLGRLIA